MKKYQIEVAGRWVDVQGTTSGMKSGWLHWQDKDGSTGLSRPGTWREMPKKDKNKSS